MTTQNRPMLAIPSTGAGNRAPRDLETLLRTGDWVADLKLDGVRATRQRERFFNRQGVDITEKFPEIRMPDTMLWLDGEIVALDGSFETVAQREKLENPKRIPAAAKANPCRFVAFDVLDLERGTPWFARREMLEAAQLMHGFPITPVGYDMAFVEQVRELGLEGVIAKRRKSRYQHDKRSPDWVKFKNLHRISCLVAGYEPGEGSRKHFGAMLLALIDEHGEVVPIGKVGTGFTRVDTHVIKALIDDGAEVLIAEIECLNLTSGNTLRFPVFRGLRSDISPTDCTTAQLESLPRS